MYFYFYFVASQVKFNHKLNRILLFLSRQKFRRIWLHISQFLIVLPHRLIFLLLLLNLGFLHPNLHAMNSLIIPIDGATSLVGTDRPKPIVDQLWLECARFKHLFLLLLILKLLLNFSHLIFLYLVKSINCFLLLQSIDQIVLFVLGQLSRSQRHHFGTAVQLLRTQIALNIISLIEVKLFQSQFVILCYFLSFFPLLSLLLLLNPFNRPIVLVLPHQGLPSLHKILNSFVIRIHLTQGGDQLGRLLIVEHVDNLFELPSLNLLFIDHLPQAVHEPGLLLQSAVLEFSFMELLLGRLDALDGSQQLSCVQQRDAGLYIQDGIIEEERKFFGYFIGEYVVAMNIYFFAGRHLLYLEGFFLLENSLMMALPLGFLIEGLVLHEFNLKFIIKIT